MRENKITNKELEKIHSQVRFPGRPLIPRPTPSTDSEPKALSNPCLGNRGIKTIRSYDFNVILIWTELIFA